MRAFFIIMLSYLIKAIVALKLSGYNNYIKVKGIQALRYLKLNYLYQP